MYKGASQNNQTRLNRVTVNDEARTGAPLVSAKEQEENLRNELSRLERELVKLDKNSPMRRPLAARKTALQTQMTLLRSGRKRGPTLDEVAMLARFRVKVEEILGEDRVKQLMVDARIEWATDNGVPLEAVLSDWQMAALKEELGVKV